MTKNLAAVAEDQPGVDVSTPCLCARTTTARREEEEKESDEQIRVWSSMGLAADPVAGETRRRPGRSSSTHCRPEEDAPRDRSWRR